MWILHQDSLLREYQSLTLNSSPTLSYTQRLEERVAQLEAALSEATKRADSWRSNHAAGDLVSTGPHTSLLYLKLQKLMRYEDYLFTIR